MFLPVVLAVYFATPQRGRSLVLDITVGVGSGACATNSWMYYQSTSLDNLKAVCATLLAAQVSGRGVSFNLTENTTWPYGTTSIVIINNQ